VVDSLANTKEYLTDHSTRHNEHQTGLRALSEKLSKLPTEKYDDSELLKQFSEIQKSSEKQSQTIEGLKTSSSKAANKIDTMAQEVTALKASLKSNEEQTKQALKTLEQISKNQEELLQFMKNSSITQTARRQFRKLLNSTKTFVNKGWTAALGFFGAKNAKGLSVDQPPFRLDQFESLLHNLVLQAKKYFHLVQTQITTQLNSLQVPKQYLETVSLTLTGLLSFFALVLVFIVLYYFILILFVYPISFCCSWCCPRRRREETKEDFDGEQGEAPDSTKRRNRGTTKKPKSPSPVRKPKS